MDIVVSVLLGEKDTWLNLLKTMDKDDTTLHKIITGTVEHDRL
jgi:hypothetical protein